MSPAGLAQVASRGKWRPATHLMWIDQLFQKLLTPEPQRIIIQAPPRHGKSQLGSLYLPVWYLGRFPDREVLLTSATDRLAREFSLACREVMREWGDMCFNVRLRQGRQSRDFWQISGGGALRAAGIGGDVMGRGADLLIIDDYCKSHAQADSHEQRDATHRWYHATSSTRLSPSASVIVIATRWHADDLIGRLLKEAPPLGVPWTIVRLPALAEPQDPLEREPGAALWPERFDAQWLAARKAGYVSAGYEWLWEALYQQSPPDQLSQEWPNQYFGPETWVDSLPVGEAARVKVMALDPSLGADDKADFSALVSLQVDSQGVHWIDADLARRDASRIALDSVDLAARFRPDVFAVETNQFQQLLADLIQREAASRNMFLNVLGMKNQLPKLSRIRSLTALLAQGKFRFVRSPGCALLVEQLRNFPRARHDDGPDALEMAVRAARIMLEEPQTGQP